MEKLTIDQLKPGNIYYFETNTDDQVLSLFSHIEEENYFDESYLTLNQEDFVSDNTDPIYCCDIDNIREATPEQEAHFMACEKASGYVGPPGSAPIKMKKKGSVIDSVNESYRKGVIFLDLVHGLIWTVSENNSASVASDGSIYVEVEKRKDKKNKTARVYKGGTFALITREPEKKSKSLDFEVGKWYRVYNESYIGRFEKLTKRTEFWTTEWIYGGKYRKNSSPTTAGTNGKIIEVPLEEIQQYLPKGHPDLISEKFVLPKSWYVVVTMDNADILSKWRFENLSGKLKIGNITGLYEGKTREHNPAGAIKGFGQEITFDQFKEHVLKSKTMEKDSLPEKWCLKVTKENKKVLGSWRTDGSILGHDGNYIVSYHNSKKGWNYMSRDIVPLEFIEITYEQFRQYVLKVESSGKPDDLLAEAKRLYPVGTKCNNKNIIPYDCDFTITSSTKFIKQSGGEIWIETKGARYTLKNKKGWATITTEVVTKGEVSSDIPGKHSSKEELMAYAREHYPIGTTHEGDGGGIFTVRHELDLSTNIYSKGDSGCIYHYGKGTWAKIIANPKSKEDSVEVEDWLVFNNNGGAMGTGALEINVPLQIEKLSKPYKAKGTCDAIFTNKQKARISELGGYYEGKYEKYFRKANQKEIDYVLDKQKAKVVPKAVPEKWAVGTYVVFLRDSLQGNGFKTNTIQEIFGSDETRIRYNKGMVNSISGSNDVSHHLKWFPTWIEATEFCSTAPKNVEKPIEVVVDDSTIADSWYITINSNNRDAAKEFFTKFRRNSFMNKSRYGVNPNGSIEFKDVSNHGNLILTRELSDQEFFTKIGYIKDEVKKKPKNQPKKKEESMKKVFQIGDKVEVTQSGYGCASSEVGMVVDIAYKKGNEYETDPKIGNNLDGSLIDYRSFSSTSKPYTPIANKSGSSSHRTKRFNVGDSLTYKRKSEVPTGYYYNGGTESGGAVGKIISYGSWNISRNCYKIEITHSEGQYSMLEDEFYEYDGITSKRMESPKTHVPKMILQAGKVYYASGYLFRFSHMDGSSLYYFSEKTSNSIYTSSPSSSTLFYRMFTEGHVKEASVYNIDTLEKMEESKGYIFNGDRFQKLGAVMSEHKAYAKPKYGGHSSSPPQVRKIEPILLKV